MKPELDELCEWCFEKGRERAATSVLAGVPLCESCSTDTRQDRFTEKKPELFEPDSALAPVKKLSVAPQQLKQMVADAGDGFGDLVNQVHAEIDAAKKPQVKTPVHEPREPEDKMSLPSAPPELCRCGKPYKHRGRCPSEGTKDVTPIRKKITPLMRTKALSQDDVEQQFPNADAFIADSALRVPLGNGELMLMYRGDLFELLQSKDDLHFLLALIHTIQCRGKMMYPFSETIKDPTRMGKFLNVQLEEGFIEDMLRCMEPEDKAKVLSVFWSKGL
jgi:hypothetical protein